MSRVRTILIHYGWQAALLVLAWSARRVHSIAGRRARRRRGAASSYTLVDSPGEYKASNPPWLVKAASSISSTGFSATDVPLECPQLTAFKGRVAKDGALSVELGTQCRQLLLCLSEKAAYLNHGSYGAAFRLAMDVQRWYQMQAELQPVKFFETTALGALVAAVREVAAFVHADARDIVPVTNATTAVNTVLQSLKLRQNDIVLLTNCTYPAVKSAIARVAASAGAHMLVLQLGLKELQEPQQLLALVQEAVAAHRGRLRLAVLDHVVSFPPVVLPIKELVSICKKAGARVLVDGAHAVGAILDLDVPGISADYYTSNLHKWCCTPKGAAFLWVTTQLQPSVKPLVTSHGYSLGFQGEFLWQGTQDMSAWLAAPASLAVLHALGHKRVVEHNDKLVKAAAHMLCTLWGTTEQVGGDAYGKTCGMLALRLSPLEGLPQPTATDATQLHEELRNQHNIEVPVIALNGQLWVRISAQVYNTMDDYKRLGDVIAGMMVPKQT